MRFRQLDQVSITVKPRSILAMPAHQTVKKDSGNRKGMPSGMCKSKPSDMIAVEDSWPVSEAQMKKLLKGPDRDFAETWMKMYDKSYDANGVLDVPVRVRAKAL